MALSGPARVILDTTTLQGVSQVRLSRREKLSASGRDANLHTYYRTQQRHAPMIDIATADLAGLLGKLTDLEYPAWTLAAPGVTMTMLQAAASAAGLAAGTVHTRATIAAGITVLDRIAWSAGDNTVIASATALGLSANGTTNPVATTQVAAPTNLGVGTSWALTACTVLGQAITDTQAIDLNFNHMIANDQDECYQNGLPFPTRLTNAAARGAGSIEGSIDCCETFTTFDGSGAVVLVFTEKTENSAAMGGTTRTFTFAASMVLAGDIDDGGPAKRRIRFLASHDGTNRPCTIA